MKRLLWCLIASSAVALAASAVTGAPAPLRGVISKAKKPIVMDGKLDEWGGAFATPVNFGHADWEERAAVWHYLWDEANLYIGLQCLDSEIFNADPGPIYNGDGVEFYLDLREGDMLGNPQFTPGTLHLFYTAASNGRIMPRIQIRGGIPAFQGVTPEGITAAAAKTETGYTLEFRLPWSKVPGFQPAAGKEIGIDCELCSSDGGPRVDRCWAYSGVAAVASPAVYGRVRLVEDWDPADAAAYSDALFPGFVARSTPLNEPATAFVGVSPAVQPLVKRVEMTRIPAAGNGEKLPFTSLKRFGPDWLRAQACLVGFLKPDDAAVEVRFFGEGDKLLGMRTLPVK